MRESPIRNFIREKKNYIFPVLPTVVGGAFIPVREIGEPDERLTNVCTPMCHYCVYDLQLARYSRTSGQLPVGRTGLRVSPGEPRRPSPHLFARTRRAWVRPNKSPFLPTIDYGGSIKKNYSNIISSNINNNNY